MKEMIDNFIKSLLGKWINRVGIETVVNDLIERICKKDYKIKDMERIEDIKRYIRKQQIPTRKMSPNDISYLINEYIKEEL
jgi:hypothetical protein